MAEIALIVAMGENREIGKNNQLLWHLPEDMQFFKKTTIGHVVIMGRKNWESIPEKFRPLIQRENYVLSQNKLYAANGAHVSPSLLSCIEHAEKTHPNKTIFIIGGAQIYALALKELNISTIYVTEVKATFNADTFFPHFDQSTYNEAVIQRKEQDQKHPYSFIIKKYWKK